VPHPFALFAKGWESNSLNPESAFLHPTPYPLHPALVIPSEAAVADGAEGPAVCLQPAKPPKHAIYIDGTSYSDFADAFTTSITIAPEMTQEQVNDRPNLQATIRTLLLSGFKIENNQRQPTHREIYCSAPILGTYVPLLFVLTDKDDLPSNVRPQVESAAKRSNRTLVIVANIAAEDQLGWIDFLDSLGGAVPSWRALDKSYPDQLETAGKNAKPEGFGGEAWRLFESLVADGLEFIFGRKVRRLGAAKRGQKVSDMIAQTPEGSVLVLDAKATSKSFNAAIFELRALAEYTQNQRLRQRGFADVFAAVVVSRAFDQDEAALSQISREFTSQAGVPVAFLETKTLIHFINCLRDQPNLRSGLKWRFLFAGGLVTSEMFDAEIEALKAERY